MRFFFWGLLFRKLKEDAENNGMSPFVIYIIASTLMSVLGVLGFFAGLYFLGQYGSYICMIAFTALGYYISHVIANHSFVDYTPRNKNMLTQQDSYISNNYFKPWTHIQLIYAQITIVQENGNSAPQTEWEFFLNGRKAGTAKDGSPITFPTGSSFNVLVARDSTGALSPPFEFSVKSGRHSEVLFREGRFEGARNIGKMSLSDIRRSSGHRSRAGDM